MRKIINNYKNINLFYDKQNPYLIFAAGEVENSLKQQGYSVKHEAVKKIKKSFDNKYNIIIGTIEDQDLIKSIKIELQNPEDCDEESFIIDHNFEGNINSYWIIGGGNAGAMYGGIDFSEEIIIGNFPDIQPKSKTPFIKKRGIKLNIPLDARTPSYSDGGAAAQDNINVMWDIKFWKKYIDELARQKYNVLSLWNLHPFPSLIKVDDYSEIALDNVMQADIDWAQFNTNFDLTGINMVTEKVLSNLSLIKELSIEEKIQFWQKVMEYAVQRNIEVYFITWNIFTWGTNGKYGIDNSADNSTTRDYFRKSVKALFKTYPKLSGIGVTAGENMEDMSAAEKEKWLFATYGQGVMDVLQDNPDREIRFIHRHWWSDLDNIIETFQPLIDHKNVKFDFSFKYSRAHMYSSTDPVFSDEVFNTLPEDKKMWCNLRNDDIFLLRWGGPDYVRDYLLNLPAQEKSPGFFMGSDGYVFGRECVSLDAEKPPQMSIDKHWFNFKLWGMLAFNPEEKNVHFRKIIKNKFNLDDDQTQLLFSAWRSVSQIIPLVNKFHWNDWDFQWHVESCCGREGYHTVDDFIHNPTMEGTDLINIPDYYNKKSKGEKIEALTPDQVARILKEKGDDVLQKIDRLENSDPASGNKELNSTIDDIRAMSYLGCYYAHKIKGALNLYFYRNTDNTDSLDKCYFDKAVDNLKKSTREWEKYTDIISSNYKNPLLARVGKIDWDNIKKQVQADIENIIY